MVREVYSELKKWSVAGQSVHERCFLRSANDTFLRCRLNSKMYHSRTAKVMPQIGPTPPAPRRAALAHFPPQPKPFTVTLILCSVLTLHAHLAAFQQAQPCLQESTSAALPCVNCFVVRHPVALTTVHHGQAHRSDPEEAQREAHLPLPSLAGAPVQACQGGFYFRLAPSLLGAPCCCQARVPVRYARHADRFS